MNCKKLDKLAGKRATWISLTFFLFFVMCFSWVLDARGYFFRFWNGTQIRISNVELTVPKGYYIDSKEKREYVICDIDDNRVQLYIETWKGKPKLGQMAERVKRIGGVVRTYELYGQSVHEFFFRNDSWEENLCAIVYLFPDLNVKITYAGPIFDMYRTMNKFIRNAKKTHLE